MSSFYDQFEEKTFSCFAEECQRVFKFFYPAVNADANGFTEAPLISNFFASIRRSDNPLNESVWWDEFPLPNDIRFVVNGKKKNSNHFDALLYDPKTKSVLMMEAKNGQTKLNNVVEIVEDIIRMANVANNPSVLAGHFWNDPDKHSVLDAFSPESFNGLYGMNLFWFWDNSQSGVETLTEYICTKIARYMRFPRTRDNAFIDSQRGDLSIRPVDFHIKEIDVGYPGLGYRCYVCCYLWRHKNSGSQLLNSESVLDRPQRGFNAFMSILDKAVADGHIDQVKTTDTKQSLSSKYVYIWPNAFQIMMVDLGSYAGNNRQVWIDLTGGNKPIALVVIDKARSVIKAPDGWSIQRHNKAPYSLDNDNGAIYHLGPIDDLSSSEGLDRLQLNFENALDTISEICFS